MESQEPKSGKSKRKAVMEARAARMIAKRRRKSNRETGIQSGGRREPGEWSGGLGELGEVSGGHWELGETGEASGGGGETGEASGGSGETGEANGGCDETAMEIHGEGLSDIEDESAVSSDDDTFSDEQAQKCF
jgi:hypothetical protein